MTQCIARTLGQLRRASRLWSLYPPGHPSHAAALSMAREALEEAIESGKELCFAATPEGLRYEGEAVPDPDGSLRDLASSLREQGICGVAVRRDVGNEELSLLLELLGPSGASDDAGGLADRLERMGARSLRVQEIDYAQFLPMSQVVGYAVDAAAAAEGLNLLREMVSAPSDQGWDLPAEEATRLLASLEDPAAMADALACGAASGPGAGGGLADGMPLLVRDQYIERLAAAGHGIALTIQRLASLGVERAPDHQDALLNQLAAALRRLDPRLLGYVLRADTAPDPGALDALTEIARRFSLDEIVDLIGSHPEAVSSESSAAWRRLAQRVAPNAARARELRPALRRGLVAYGVAEGVFDTTIGLLLEELGGDETQADEEHASLPVRRPSEEVRAARREEIHALLRAQAETTGWADRALVCIELLQLPQPAERCATILGQLERALEAMSESERRDVEVSAVSALADVAAAGADVSAAMRSRAAAILARVSSEDAVGRLIQSLQTSEGPEQARIARAVALAGDAGRTALLALLTSPKAMAEPRLIDAVVSGLVDAEAEGATPQGGLAAAILDPACRQSSRVITALVSKGGPVATRHLTAAFQGGGFGVRAEIVNQAGTRSRDLADVLLVGLEDADPDIACAAATHLGGSGSARAGRALLSRLQPSRLRDRHLRTRLAAAMALGALQYRPAVPVLAQVVERPHWFSRRENDALREAAARALIQIGTEEALQIVASRAGRDRSAAVREAAAHAAETAAQKSPAEATA